MSFMKELYEKIVEAVKQLKLKPCADTYNELETLLNRSIPSDGSEDVVKYYTIKALLKSKAIIPGNIASNDTIRYMALWMTPDMIVRHFDLQNHIELTFTQTSRFVQGDFIRGDYTVREVVQSSPLSSSTSSEFTLVGSKKNRDNRDTHNAPSQTQSFQRDKNPKNIRHNSGSSSYANRSVKYKNPRSNQDQVQRPREIRDINTRTSKSDSPAPIKISKSDDQINKESEEDDSKDLKKTEKLSSSINWGVSSNQHWGDMDSDSD